MSLTPKEIAKQIIAQIGSNSLACMGVPPKSVFVIPASDKHNGGLQFKFTNCPKVRTGTVRITVDGTDLYTVQILNVRGREIYKAEGIYNDMLGGPSGVIEGVTG
jgi:hypothetical protein